MAMASKKTDARPSHLSEEYVQDSSDESEKSDEDDSTERGTPKATAADDPAEETIPNGVARASEQEDAPASESPQSSQESSSSGNDGNKSTGEHSNVSSGSKKRIREPEKLTETTTSSKKRKKRKGETPVQIPSKPFTPPAGFEAVIPDASDYASEAAGIFTDLSNKQVWHISAPATVSVSSIKEFDIAAALKGDPILTQNGVSYGLQPATSSADTLLLPQDSHEAYAPSKTRISRGFQLKAIDQEIHHKNHSSMPRNSGTLATDKLMFTAQAPGHSLPPRQQPTGLITRYVPYGVVDRDKSAKRGRAFPGLSDPESRKAATTNPTRVPEGATAAAPGAAADHMDLDENSTTVNGVGDGGPQRPADPSPAKSSIPETPRENHKKKKKRSKLVDDQRI